MNETEQHIDTPETNSAELEASSPESATEETTSIPVSEETETAPGNPDPESHPSENHTDSDSAAPESAELPDESGAVDATDVPETSDEATDTEAVQPISSEEPRTQEGMNWFVLRVASNKEDFVRNALEKKVQIEGVQHLVGRIMVPTEKTKTLTKTGKTKITETKLYPGYIFVEMKLVDARISQDVFFLIKETTGVGDFVGTAGKPTPMSTDEVDKMLYDSQAPEEVTEVKLEFAKGDHVNVKDGPFMGYEGTVDEIYPEKGIVRVLATVFGRQTPLDIEYWMIEKAE